MTRRPDAVMLFAAGFGTRMGALTKDRPKPLIEVAGRPLIDHALDLTDDLRADRVVANLHYLPDQLATHLAPKGVLMSREEPEILETGGGLRAALPLLGPGPVFTLNTDAIWSGPNPLTLLRKAWNPDRMDALLMCVPIAQTVGHAGSGDFTTNAEGRISRGPGLVYGGAQIVKTDGLAAISEQAFSLNLLWDQMHELGRLFATIYPGRWCDVGRPEGVAMAEELIADV
ncbi:bifunctional N-acetylglucosamine-1-phosphate uridyltransferase/glucosamine-1-phosphate acetyltransferase [Ruegeria denitrificans]|uniref:Bifunctional N-acetylglucosamine-1-phosphate uridyltransferase/glucosamine-1-phosphate acetyltransferase n=1 Tax=Ruegeria denitrificans TaxID=1715692 RepID=A0A0P1IHT4_9RHOB|nr:nucleotidyltransferase family protein [Ruegeria denitrificans]CUK13911.1 bifunctional N-acetylglucosamine-1-phosphate uridyltransferase/glucosamine-1-phosphate acetyltransferase [Ruegeria denitrificans]